MDPLTTREIELVEKIGMMKGILEIYENILLCMTVRLGGTVNIDNKELHFTGQNYRMEKVIKADDLTQDIKINARLK